MGMGPQPAPKALWALVHQNFLQTRFDGIYNDRFTAKTKTKSLHAEGRALDIGLLVSVPDEKLIGDQLFDAFIEHAIFVGFQESIWNRVIWSDANPTKLLYQGADAHTGHIHAGFTRSGSQQTVFPVAFVNALAVVRSGIEDLAKANRCIG